MIFSKLIFENFKFGQYLLTPTACRLLGLGASSLMSQGVGAKPQDATVWL